MNYINLRHKIIKYSYQLYGNQYNLHFIRELIGSPSKKPVWRATKIGYISLFLFMLPIYSQIF